MKKRTERSRWVNVFMLPEPSVGSEAAAEQAREKHRQALAVVKAFEAVGRVVRLESANYGPTIIFRARKS